jgi:hypothetical protein
MTCAAALDISRFFCQLPKSMKIEVYKRQVYGKTRDSTAPGQICAFPGYRYWAAISLSHQLRRQSASRIPAAMPAR